MAEERVLTTGSERWSRIDHVGAGFSIALPSGWRVARDVWGAALAAVAPEADGFAPNVNVVRYERAPTSTFESFVSQHVVSLRRLLTDLQVIDRTDVSLGESAAVRLVLAYRQGAFEVTQLQWLTETPAATFVISAACETPTFDRWSPVFEQMAGSFVGR